MEDNRHLCVGFDEFACFDRKCGGITARIQVDRKMSAEGSQDIYALKRSDMWTHIKLCECSFVIFPRILRKLIKGRRILDDVRYQFIAQYLF